VDGKKIEKERKKVFVSLFEIMQLWHFIGSAGCK
jgi:hypothetical protein